MITARTVADLNAQRNAFRARKERVALVPTMGALHEGHLSLIESGLQRADRVVVSVFVNPLQFGAGEDFEVYPRDLEGDAAAAAERGAHVLWAPSAEEMYPSGVPVVTVDPGEAGDRLCGAHRPGHFRGVLTVVAKLFGQVEPDVAIFGRKDFQQSVLIRRMVDDLDYGVAVHVAPIVREADGLALSSRNRFLTREERADAARISAGLRLAQDRFDQGDRSRAALVGAYLSEVAQAASLRPQYQELVDPADLTSIDLAEPGSVLAIAAHCGGTRLIDNVVLGEGDGL